MQMFLSWLPGVPGVLMPDMSTVTLQSRHIQIKAPEDVASEAEPHFSEAQ